MLRHYRWLPLICCFCLIWSARRAQGQAKDFVRVPVLGQEGMGERWAVIIGVSKYQHPGVDLNFAADDARDFSHTLQTTCGFQEDHIKLLCDAEATTARVRTALGTWLPPHAGPRDLVIIYFSGHGCSDNDTSGVNEDGIRKYLVTHNTDPDNLYGTGIPLDELTGILLRLRSEQTVVLLDSCYSGAAGAAGVGLPRTFHRQGVNLPGPLKRNFVDALGGAGIGRVIMTACDPNEKSWEYPDFKHGAFTHYLLEGLKGGAADDRGQVTVMSLYSYISRELSKPAAGRNVQHPTNAANYNGEPFALTEKGKAKIAGGMGRLKVITSPLGADIYVDRLLAKTPLDLKLMSGDHHLIIDKPGYMTESEDIYVGPDDVTVRSYILKTQETRGDLLVQAQPGANLIIDQKAAGAIPATGRSLIQGLEAAPHQVRIEAAGFISIDQVVVVPAGRAGTVQFKLERDLANKREAGPQDVAAGLHRVDNGHYVWDRDDSEMVFVSEGTFWMGNDADDTARPRHEQPCPAFWIDKYEVTNAQFMAFVKAAHYQVKGLWKPQPGLERLPVVQVTLEDARAYAEWAGKVIPSEIQWEKAARGTDGRLYPYGDMFNALCQNVPAYGIKKLLEYDKLPEGRSPYGAMNMLGNASEWCDSPFVPYPNAPALSPYFNKGYYTIRGGSYQAPALKEDLSVAMRRFSPPNRGAEDLGFRCATPVPAR